MEFATSTEQLLHQKNTIKNYVNCFCSTEFTDNTTRTLSELLHQQNTKNTIRTMTVNCYINRTQITQQELGQGLLHQQNTKNTIRTMTGNCCINRTQKNTIKNTVNCYINRTQKQETQ